MSDNRPEFAEFDELGSVLEPIQVQIRAAVPSDSCEIAEIHAQRHGIESQDVLLDARREIEAIEKGDQLRYCCVAEIHQELIGYGKAAMKEYEADAASRSAPTGWYLTGLVVSPNYRRRGVGLAITKDRLKHLEQLGATEVWYFASAVNRVTIALHQDLGFQEVTRNFEIPGVSFTGGTGILFRKSLIRWRSPDRSTPDQSKSSKLTFFDAVFASQKTCVTSAGRRKQSLHLMISCNNQ